MRLGRVFGIALACAFAFGCSALFDPSGLQENVGGGAGGGGASGDAAAETSVSGGSAEEDQQAADAAVAMLDQR